MGQPNNHLAGKLLIVGTLSLLIIGASYSNLEPSASTIHRHLQPLDEGEDTLFPLGWRDIAAFSAAAVGLILAAGGGIGGGGMLVPIYLIILGFGPEHAIPLSNVTIFGGSLANFLLNAGKRHPEADRPMIDYDLIFIMVPLAVSGTLVGTHLNVLLPDVVVILCLVLLLAFTTRKTWSKANKMNAQETSNTPAVAARPGTETMLDEETPLIPNDNTQSEDSLSKSSSINNISLTASTGSSDETDLSSELAVDATTRELSLAKILEEERSPQPKPLAIISAMFLFVLAVNVLKGGGGFESPLGIHCPSFAFWGVELLLVIVTVGVCIYARAYLLHKASVKEEVGYVYLESDFRWDGSSTLTIPAVCFLAGVIAGLCGVGGGLILAPLMLALNVHPSVAAATSATMILFTSFIASTSFLVFGVMALDYAAVGLTLGFVATYLGQTVMNVLVKRTGRPSYIAFCIAWVVLVSAVTLTAQWVVSLFHESGHSTKGFCGSHHH